MVRLRIGGVGEELFECLFIKFDEVIVVAVSIAGNEVIVLASGGNCSGSNHRCGSEDGRNDRELHSVLLRCRAR